MIKLFTSKLVPPNSSAHSLATNHVTSNVRTLIVTLVAIDRLHWHDNSSGLCIAKAKLQYSIEVL